MKILIFILFFVSTVVSAFSQSDRDWFIKARLAISKKNNDSALCYLNKAIQAVPEILYLNERADVLFSMKKYKEALSDYTSIDEKSPAIVKYKLAGCYSLLDSLPQATAYLKSYLASADKIPEFMVKKDTLFTNLKKSSGWEEIWKTNWYNEYENYLGELNYLFSKGKMNDLFDVIDSALNRYPDKSELWLWRAKAFTYGNNPKEAMRSLDMAIKFNPSRTDVLLMRAGILRKEGKSKKAILDYNAALTYEPWNILYLKERGIAKIESGEYKSAIDDLLNYFTYDTLNDQIVYNVGRAFYLMKDLKNAILYFTASIKINNGAADSFCERGRCYLDLFDYENAFSDLCMAVDLNSGNGEYFYYRGLAYYGKKNKLGACHDWEKARDLNYLEAEQYMLRFCATE